MSERNRLTVIGVHVIGHIFSTHYVALQHGLRVIRHTHVLRFWYLIGGIYYFISNTQIPVTNYFFRPYVIFAAQIQTRFSGGGRRFNHWLSRRLVYPTRSTILEDIRDREISSFLVLVLTVRVSVSPAFLLFLFCFIFFCFCATQPCISLAEFSPSVSQFSSSRSVTLDVVFVEGSARRLIDSVIKYLFIHSFSDCFSLFFSSIREP